MKEATHKNVILLTGATGYLGSNILPRLLDAGYEVIVLKRSFSNTTRIAAYLEKITYYDIDTIEYARIFEEHTIDTILHCATHYGRKDKGPLQTVEANLLLPLQLLELGRQYGIKHFINTDTILDKRINSYSLSKRQFKDWLLSYKNEMVCVNIALEHFYGPGDDDTKFVSYIVRSLLNNVAYIDLTKGEQTRDFVYIDDVVAAFMFVLQHMTTWNNNFHYFEIGTNSAVSIKELVLLIKKYSKNSNTKLNFGALPYRDNEVMSCVADTSAINRLGWNAQYSLEQGLQKTVAQELSNTHI